MAEKFFGHLTHVQHGSAHFQHGGQTIILKDEAFKALSYCFGFRDRTDYIAAMDDMWINRKAAPVLLQMKWPKDHKWPWIRKI